MSVLDEATVREIVRASADRFELATRILDTCRAASVAEIGVWKGKFARTVLAACPFVERYYMVDPWRHLEAWNKPFNLSSEELEAIYDEAIVTTDFASHRRVVCRGTLTEVRDEIADGSLDFAYIDGDHTLRGILVDLTILSKKVRECGLILGDDCRPSIWQHGEGFEPTLVFPVVLHFAEALGAQLYALPYWQFLLVNGRSPDGHRFLDLTDRYGECALLPQIKPRGG